MNAVIILLIFTAMLSDGPLFWICFSILGCLWFVS